MANRITSANLKARRQRILFKFLYALAWTYLGGFRLQARPQMNQLQLQ